MPRFQFPEMVENDQEAARAPLLRRGWGDTLPVQLDSDGARTLATGIVFEDPVDRGGLCRADHAIARCQGAVWQDLAVQPVAVADTAC